VPPLPLHLEQLSLNALVSFQGRSFFALVCPLQAGTDVVTKSGASRPSIAERVSTPFNPQAKDPAAGLILHHQEKLARNGHSAGSFSRVRFKPHPYF